MGIFKRIIKILLLTEIISCSEYTLEKISLEDYPLAKCNDLTTAVYYRHHKINQQSSKKMLIFLQGGGFCVPGDGPENCNERCIDEHSPLCTAMTAATINSESDYISQTIASKNSTVNPTFYDFSTVFVPYCSSDLYSGTANASTDTEGRAFQGKNIFKAIISNLLSTTWLAEAEEVVLAGSSAGGFGVERNCDWMADQLKFMNPDMTIKCIIDSGSLIPMETFFDYCFENNVESNEGMIYWEAELDESCMNESPDPETECAGLSTFYPYLETTSMILTSATDKHSTTACDNKHDEVFLQSWRDELVQLIRKISSERPDFGFFVENCSFHGVLRSVHKYHWTEVPVDDGGLLPGKKLVPRELVDNFWNHKHPRVGIDHMDELNDDC